jgi:hypothetical protein
MASKYFKLFNFGKKVGPTIQGVAPKIAKTTNEKIKRTMGQIKRTVGARTKKLADDMEMKSKEIKDTLDKIRTPKADGGSISPKDIKKMTEKAEPAAKRAFDILRRFGDKKKKKNLPVIPPKQIKGDSGKQKEKPTGKDKPKSIREKIAPKKKMDRLKELRKELG